MTLRAPLSELLGESDEKPLRAADVAEAIRVFILDEFAYEPSPVLAEPFNVSSRPQRT